MEVQWPEAPLAGFALSGAILIRANIECADFTGTNLSMADLREANLKGASLRGVTLTGARLQGAILIGADLTAAQLQKVNLEQADLRAANFRNAIFEETRIFAAIYDDDTSWPSGFNPEKLDVVHMDYINKFRADSWFIHNQLGIQAQFVAVWKRSSRLVRKEMESTAQKEGVPAAIAMGNKLFSRRRPSNKR